MPGDLFWVRQFGTPEADGLRALALLPGGAAVGGGTFGSLAGVNQGGSDLLLARFDREGGRLWLVQLGSSGEDRLEGLATASDGTLWGLGPWEGVPALFHFDTDGSLLGRWTPALEGGTYLEALIWGADGALYAAGTAPPQNSDALLLKLSPAGAVLWSRTVGADGVGTQGLEFGHAVAPRPEGGACLGGSTTSSLEGGNQGAADAFLACYDGEGNRLWLKQWGTPAGDVTVGLVADGAGLYALVGSGMGGVLLRYDAGGNPVWESPLRTGDGIPLSPWALAQAPGGGVYVAGQATYDLGFGRRELYLALNRYDAQGSLLSSRLLGSGGRQEGLEVAAEAEGVYLAGTTEGQFPGQRSQGSWDAFLARFRP